MAVGDAYVFPGFLTPVLLNLTFLPKATDYFSHMLLQRWEAKIRRKEKLPQLLYMTWDCSLRACNTTNDAVLKLIFMRTGGRWFNPQLGQYSVWRLMIWSFRQDSFLSHGCQFFLQWICGIAASGMERILSCALVKELQEGMDRLATVK